MPTNLEKCVNILRNLLKDRPVYCFVGAGLSLNHPEMKGWQELLDELGRHLQEETYPKKDETIQYFQRAMSENNLKKAGEIYKDSCIYYTRKQEKFTKLFLHNKLTTNVHIDLLKIGFDGILTTNYDHFLEDAYSHLRGRSILPYLPNDIIDDNFTFGNSFFIAKLHGDAARWNSIVIGETDYVNAQWIKNTKKLVDAKTLVVFGISGKDPIINEFLLKLSPETRIAIFMSGETKNEYIDILRSTLRVDPLNLMVEEIAHDELCKLISLIKPSHAGQNLIDCKWGEMPPMPQRRFDFGYTENEFRDFRYSQKKTVLIQGRSGDGLSSFLAQSLTDGAILKDAHILRMEVKNFLPVDAYILHIITSKKEIYEHYTQKRHNYTGEWTLKSEAETICEAFSLLRQDVIVAVEHINRLSNDGILFFKNLIAGCPDNLKLVFVDQKDNQTSLNYDHLLNLDKPNKKNIEALCENYKIADVSIPKQLLIINDTLNYNFLISAGVLIDRKIVKIEEIKDFILESNQKKICELIIKNHKEDSYLKLLKTAVLFRTPRTLESLNECSSLGDISKVYDIVKTLQAYGFLHSTEQANTKYAMSTGMRKVLLYSLSWDKEEKEEISCLIGRYFENEAFKEFDSNAREIICRTIPILSTALYHYATAQNPTAYVNLIWRIRKHIIHMYHSNVLDFWLKECPHINGDKMKSVVYKINYIKAELSRCRSLVTDYKQYLDIAQNTVDQINSKDLNQTQEHQKLIWNRGIMLTMKREYKAALTLFDDFAEANKDPQTRDYYRSRLRQVQTKLSLGELKQAELILNSTNQCLQSIENNLVQINPDLVKHTYSMIWRHISTLNILRLLFFEMQPKSSTVSEEFLLETAIKASDNILMHSRNLEGLKSRFGKGDETGIGISFLKKAQVFYAARKYSLAFEPAIKGASILSGYPNNQWWRMTCHDYAAKSLARAGNPKEAQIQLKKAEDIWLASAKEDHIRQCELAFTKGLISQANNEINAAVKYYEESVSFEEESPCIKVFHLVKLASAYMELSRTKQAKETMNKLKSYTIHW